VAGGGIRVGVAVGDASGDALGAELLAALHERCPELVAAGIAGRRMQAQGAVADIALEKLAERGGTRGGSKHRELARIRARLIQRWLAEPPALFVGIGSPEFSLPIGRRLKAAGIPTLQYAGPEVWSWRRWQVKRIAHCVDRVLTLFPFETAIYEHAGVCASYVGHPLADSLPLKIDKAAARTQLRLPHGRRIVALLPGERGAGFATLAEIFVKAARRLHNEIGEAHFVMPASSREHRELIETTVRLHADGDFPLTVLFGHAHEALAAAEVALVSSGMSSLEAALFKTPMVIAHRTSRLDWWFGRPRSARIAVGLPNLLAAAPVVPEFVQQKVTPWDLAAALIGILRDAAAREQQLAHFYELHERLRQNNAQKACDAVLSMLEHAPA
jgi:lipid-A-disaccharide synthase